MANGSALSRLTNSGTNVSGPTSPYAIMNSVISEPIRKIPRRWSGVIVRLATRAGDGSDAADVIAVAPEVVRSKDPLSQRRRPVHAELARPGKPGGKKAATSFT